MYGIKISEPGWDVKEKITETNKKHYTMLDQTENHKLFYKGIITSDYTHNLGYIPTVFTFLPNATSNPTTFEALNTITITTTQVKMTGRSRLYIIIFYE